MDTWYLLLGTFGGLTVAAWCLSWLRAWWHARQYVDLPQLATSEREETVAALPTLTVIIPACNEEGSIEGAAQSLLEQSYPNLQLIFINDRSTDATGPIIDRLAQQDDRMTALHIDTLPAGWLGKVHALSVATERADGDWLLYTDADVAFEPNALVEIVHFSETREIDHLAGLPRMKPAGTLIGWAIAAFYTSSMFFVSPKRVANPDDRIAVGVGALNLVRRCAMERTPGFEWLKMETIDDMGLGLMVKRAGGRAMVARAGQQVSLQWYQDVSEMASGLEKNSPGLAKYSVIRSLLLLSILPLALLGFACTFCLTWPFVILAWCLSAACPLLCMSSFAKQTSLPRINFLLFPLGLTLLWFIFARALFLLWRRGGVQWRGTGYGIAALKKGQRMEF